MVKVAVRKRHPDPARLSLFIVAFLVGFLVVTQLRGQLASPAPGRSTLEDARLLSDLIEANNRLRTEIAKAQQELAALRGNSSTDVDTLVSELNRLKAINGLLEVSGPGVEVELLGNPEPFEMVDLVNELRNAGAEAIAIGNPQTTLRLVYRSSIGGGRGWLVVDGTLLAGPYYLRAIGAPETLLRTLERRGGLIALLRYTHPDWVITVRPADRLTLPVYPNQITFKYARAADR
jgi:uncharacterized protein YlxW (UPF0749 family)